MTKRKLWAKVRELENRVAALDFRQRALGSEVLVTPKWEGDHYEWGVEFLDVEKRYVWKTVATAQRFGDKKVRLAWHDGVRYVEVWGGEDALLEVKKVLPSFGVVLHTDAELYLNCYLRDEVLFEKKRGD